MCVKNKSNSAPRKKHVNNYMRKRISYVSIMNRLAELARKPRCRKLNLCRSIRMISATQSSYITTLYVKKQSKTSRKCQETSFMKQVKKTKIRLIILVTLFLMDVRFARYKYAWVRRNFRQFLSNILNQKYKKA